MNEVTTTHDGPTVEVLRHYYVDADGNEIEIPFDPDTSEGADASEEGTIFVAEDATDHVTVH